MHWAFDEKMLYIILLLSVITITNCDVNSSDGISKRATNFGIELLYFSSEDLDNHLIISPFQVWTLLATLSQGASGNTYNQMKQALSLYKHPKKLYKEFNQLNDVLFNNQPEGVNIKVSNNLFYDVDSVSVKTEYINVVSSFFKTQLTPLKFADDSKSSSVANRLISETTDGQMKDVLYSTDFKDAKIVLLNVMNFKGNWLYPFNKSETRVGKFYGEDGKILGEVNLMHQQGVLPYSNMPALNAHVLELPYDVSRRFSLLVILPHQNKRVKDVYKGFKKVTLGDIFKQLDDDLELYSDSEVHCYIPRFKVQTDVELKNIVSKFGVYDMFDSTKADFSRMSDRNLFVSKIIHKAVIEVTEEGTSASSSSAALLPDRMGPTIFSATRPFIYMVVERQTETLLFGGVYSKPAKF